MFNVFKRQPSFTNTAITTALQKLDPSLDFDKLIKLYEKERNQSHSHEFYLEGKGKDALFEFLTGLVLYEKKLVVVVDWKDSVPPPPKGFKFFEFKSQHDTRNFYKVPENTTFTPEEKHWLKIS